MLRQGRKIFLGLFMFTIAFLCLQNVSAAEYSSATCVYTDDLKDGDFDLTVKYTEQGELTYTKKIKSIGEKYISGCSISYNDPDYKTKCYDHNAVKAEYKVVIANLPKSKFVSGKALNPTCPGTNDIDYYQVDDIKTIFIAWSEDSLKAYVDSKPKELKKKNGGYYKGNYYKAKLKSQNIVQGDKIIINGKTYNVEKGKTCNYKHKTNDWQVHLEIDSTGKARVATFSGKVDGSSKNFPISEVEGTFSKTHCPNAISISGKTDQVEGGISSNTKRIKVYRDSSDGKYKMHIDRDTSSGNGNGDPTVPIRELEITDENGCKLWGSLLTFFNSFIYGTIKFSLVGLLIVLGMLDFSKAVFSDDSDALKKASKKFMMRFVVVILFFLLPVIIETLLNWFISSENIDACLSSFK